MDKLYKLLIPVITLIALNLNLSVAGIKPTFNMTVKDIIHPLQNASRDSIIEFSVYCQQTNFGSPGVDPFEYCAGQFTWYFNKALLQNGGVTTFSLRSSALPIELLPPSFQIDTVNGYLQASGNLPNSHMNYFISSVFPGTFMARYRIRTTGNHWPNVPLNLRFKLGASPNTFIAYFLPYPDSVDTETFPPPQQSPVTLMDTVSNIYTVENPPPCLHCIPPIPDFSADSTIIPIGGSVDFVDLSFLGPTSWSWSFPGGTPSSSELRNPTSIVYNAPGFYSVSMTVGNNYGANTITKPNYITVSNCILDLDLKVITEGLYSPSLNKLSRRDTVTVFLRSSAAPYSILDSARGVIDSLTFSKTFRFVKAPAGSHYIVVRHFNSIETWSKAGGSSFTCGVLSSYDFTTAASQAYGNNLQINGSKYCIYSGDVDRNGVIDLTDLIKIFNDSRNFLTGRYLPADLNGDSIVDLSDISLCYNNSTDFVGMIRP